MELIFVFFQWFTFCFQASFLVAKRIHFWSSFSVSGLFFEQCFIIFVLFSAILLYFSFLGALWERWGLIFHHKNGLDHTEGAPRGISPKINSVFWNHVGAFVCEFFVFLRFVFKHRFLWSSEADVSWMFASFRHIFLYFFIFVGTSDTSGF